MFLKIFCLCCAVTLVRGAPSGTDVVPLEKQQPTVIPIVSQSEEFEPNGTYKFSYETGNGIKREETAYDKVLPKVEGRSQSSNEGGESDESDEIHVQQGSYSYTAPDGTVISLRYIADENGFQPVGDHLPKAPTLPETSSGEKKGRLLKPSDNQEASSAPVAIAKSPPKAQSTEASTTEIIKSTEANELKSTKAVDEVKSTEATREAQPVESANEAKSIAAENEATTKLAESSTAVSTSAASSSEASVTEAATSAAPTASA